MRRWGIDFDRSRPRRNGRKPKKRKEKKTMKLDLRTLAETIIEDNEEEIMEAITDRAKMLFDAEAISEMLISDEEITDALIDAARDYTDICT